MEWKVDARGVSFGSHCVLPAPCENTTPTLRTAEEQPLKKLRENSKILREGTFLTMTNDH